MRSSRGRAGSDGLNETKTEPKPGTAVDVVPPRAGEPASGHGAAGTGRQPGRGGRCVGLGLGRRRRVLRTVLGPLLAAVRFGPGGGEGRGRDPARADWGARASLCPGGGV